MGALLDLNSPDGNKGGLLLSNVFIENPDSIPAYFIGMDKLSGDALEAHKAKFKGAIIYNTNPVTGVGIQVWNGSRWQSMDCLSVPAAPGAINLTETAVVSGNMFTAYINPVPHAKRYRWTYPSNLEVVGSDAGIAITLKTPTGIQQTYDAEFISVVAENGCGTSPMMYSPATMQICTTPPRPGDIIGFSSVFIDDTGMNYSIPDSEPGVTYIWTVPYDWEITAGNGTNSITVNAGSSSGMINVKPRNTCNFEGISRNFEVTAEIRQVTGITGVPTKAAVGTALTLSGTVAPANATNRTIAWSVNNAGTTGATISAGKLNTTAAGTATITATITDGKGTGDYTQDFEIISIIPATGVTINASSLTLQVGNVTNIACILLIFLIFTFFGYSREMSFISPFGNCLPAYLY